MIDHDQAVPLDWKCFCSLDVRRANFYAVQTKKVICKQSYVKNAKLTSVSKFLKMHLLVKQANFVKCDVNSLFYRKP